MRCIFLFSVLSLAFLMLPVNQALATCDGLCPSKLVSNPVAKEVLCKRNAGYVLTLGLALVGTYHYYVVAPWVKQYGAHKQTVYALAYGAPAALSLALGTSAYLWWTRIPVPAQEHEDRHQ